MLLLGSLPPGFSIVVMMAPASRPMTDSNLSGKRGDDDEDDEESSTEEEAISFDYGENDEPSPIIRPFNTKKAFSSSGTEEPAVSLLKRIFPESTASELKQLHIKRCQHLEATGASASLDNKDDNHIDSSVPDTPRVRTTRAYDDTIQKYETKTGESDECIPSPPRINRSLDFSVAEEYTTVLSNSDPPRSLQGVAPRRLAAEDKCNSKRLVVLPEDFLRLPREVAVRRRLSLDDSTTTCMRYELVKDLEQRAVSQHEQRYYTHFDHHRHQFSEHFAYCTKVVSRHPTDGLGMTIVVDRQELRNSSGTRTDGKVELEVVQVHWLAGAGEGEESPPGAAFLAGIQCGDILIGMDGVAFAESMAPHEEGSLAQHAVTRLRSGPDPAVLHVQRRRRRLDNNAHVVHGSYQSPLRQQSAITSNATESASCETPIHIPSLLDTSDIMGDSSSSPMASFTVHSDMSSPTHRIDPTNAVLLGDSEQSAVHPFVQSLDAKGLVQSREELKADSKAVYEAIAYKLRTPILNSSGVSPTKALSVRIVNRFDDETNQQTAYTLWVYDVNFGKEWYAPFRYWTDFQDLRTATMAILPAAVRRLPFPMPPRGSGLSLFRSPTSTTRETSTQKETRARVLEQFIRSLTALACSLKDQAKGAEVGIHLQSFLGGDEKVLDVPAALPAIIQVTTTPNARSNDPTSTPHLDLRLKQSIQYVTFRLFHLASLRRIVDTFVDSFRATAPHLRDMEHMEAKGHAFIKSNGLEDLGKIQQFMDKLQEMIVEGCDSDFRRMAEHYSHGTRFDSGLLSGTDDEWARSVREAVREQVEIEIYVPLRACVSRWLVHGWRYEDMEIQFKIEELRKKPPSFFRIPGEGKYDWSTASTILSKGVGLSTLPTAKLRAIVAAAREIFRVHREATTDTKARGCQQALGADEFLPIFIYCVIHAELERPCALSVPLRTLCDRCNKMGEIGYYLLTFEAAIAHCHEVDLTEERESMDSSFMSIPLNDETSGDV